MVGVSLFVSGNVNSVVKCYVITREVVSCEVEDSCLEMDVGGLDLGFVSCGGCDNLDEFFSFKNSVFLRS